MSGLGDIAIGALTGAMGGALNNRAGEINSEAKAGEEARQEELLRQKEMRSAEAAERLEGVKAGYDFAQSGVDQKNKIALKGVESENALKLEKLKGENSANTAKIRMSGGRGGKEGANTKIQWDPTLGQFVEMDLDTGDVTTHTPDMTLWGMAEQKTAEEAKALNKEKWWWESAQSEEWIETRNNENFKKLKETEGGTASPVGGEDGGTSKGKEAVSNYFATQAARVKKIANDNTGPKEPDVKTAPSSEGGKGPLLSMPKFTGEAQAATEPPPEATSTYGNRQDGTPKGTGYYGELDRPDGGVSTELSIGVEFDGEEVEIPLLIPGLSEAEIKSLLDGNSPSKEVIGKAVKHARKRISEGKSPFAGDGDTPISLPKKQTKKSDKRRDFNSSAKEGKVLLEKDALDKAYKSLKERIESLRNK